MVRVMPNTPSLVGCGVAIFSMGRAATPADGATVRRLFSSVGMCECLPESLMSAVTGLSGSGPAYVGHGVGGGGCSVGGDWRCLPETLMSANKNYCRVILYCRMV